VLPLCCWDYYDDPGRFLGWIHALEASRARLFNDPATLRWNFRKTYLLDMAAAGLSYPGPSICRCEPHGGRGADAGGRLAGRGSQAGFRPERIRRA
jgi:hypothetical protein